jgi:hypothetical protein
MITLDFSLLVSKVGGRGAKPRAGGARVAAGWLIAAMACGAVSCSKDQGPSPGSASEPEGSAAAQASASAAPAPAPSGPPPRVAAPGQGLGLSAPLGAEQMQKAELGRAYEPLWKQLFLRRNGMTEEDFAKHIKVKSSDIEGRTNVWLAVTYDVTLDWATAVRRDELLIRLAANLPLYPDIPHDVYLDEDQIGTMVDEALVTPPTTKAPHINKVDVHLKLKFASQDEAMKKLHEVAGSDDLSLVSVIFPPYHANQGHPLLQGNRTVDANKNRCLWTTVDLVTGEGQAKRRGCIAH